MLNENWILKSSLSSTVSNQSIDKNYNIALQQGAYGGKVLGAGNGGFLFLLINKKKNQKT